MIIKTNRNSGLHEISDYNELQIIFTSVLHDDIYVPGREISVTCNNKRHFRLAAIYMSETGMLSADLIPEGLYEGEPHFGFDVKKINLKSIQRILAAVKEEYDIDNHQPFENNAAVSWAGMARAVMQSVFSLRQAVR
jgi:hypothetical protein